MLLSRFFTRDKIYAFLIHLGISLVIFFVLLYLIVLHWYPVPLFHTDGGWEGIRLIAAVDIVLGPLLTLIVYRKNKPHIKLDMSLIAAIQFGALVSGIWVVYGEHPVLITFTGDRLHPIPAYQVIEAGIDLDTLDQYGTNNPPIAFVDVPEDLTAYSELVQKSRRERRPIYLVGELFQPISEKNIDRILKHAIDMDSYLADRPEDRKIFDDFLRQYNDDTKHFIYLELRSRFQWLVGVLDLRNYHLIEVLDILPPSMTQKVIKIKIPKSQPGSGGEVSAQTPVEKPQLE